MPLALWISAFFALALCAQTLLKLWLAARQMRHVARHRHAVPASFAGTVSLDAHQRAAAYTVDKLRVSLVEIVVSAAVVLGWTLLGGLDALNAALLGVVTHPLLQQLALLGAFAAIGALIDLPFSLYQTFVIEARHGFNRMSPALWLADLLKGTLVGIALGLPLAALVLWLMAASGALWWLWVWLTWTGFSVLLMLVFPTWIAPLFNRFEPLRDESLKQQVAELMARCGFRAKGLFVVDGSRRSAHANAYFTGLGAAKRVVFYDTLLDQLTPGQVQAVLAHELGHFHHRHVTKRLVAMMAFSLLALAVLGWLSQQPAFFVGLGVTPNLPYALNGVPAIPNHALLLLLFLLAVPVVSLWVTPWLSHRSRRDEFQADAYAVAQTGRADLQAALLALYNDNASTLTPDPLYARFYYSHPPASERLAHIAQAGVVPAHA
ncbi:peptidase M48 [Comamonas serinivorans]|uniref:Peptidase M48 n=2 Tax=Comamonas serinivorans TaxID=1082851 RepID=A0A1Y0ETX8_9BURK|nr:M48 family metallopeptidase [Comamonas serinivorans]ARU06871.1 peptidase M48 [Comamonas serinivorans]